MDNGQQLDTSWVSESTKPEQLGKYSVMYINGQVANAYWTGKSWADHAEPSKRISDSRALTKMVKAWRTSSEAACGVH